MEKKISVSKIPGSLNLKFTFQFDHSSISVCSILFGHMVLPWPNKLNQSINQSISLSLSPLSVYRIRYAFSYV